jgi:hypothetical protein
MSYRYEPEPRLDPPEEVVRWRCPVCGEVLNYDDKVYVNCSGTVVGCCCCLDEYAAGDVLEEN